jgi:hypothetical protein
MRRGRLALPSRVVGTPPKSQIKPNIAGGLRAPARQIKSGEANLCAEPPGWNASRISNYAHSRRFAAQRPKIKNPALSGRVSSRTIRSGYFLRRENMPVTSDPMPNRPSKGSGEAVWGSLPALLPPAAACSLPAASVEEG